MRIAVTFVTTSLVDRLLSAAETFNMPRLRSLIDLHLIAEIGIDTVADILAFTERRSMPDDSPVRRAAVRTLTDNVIEVASTPGWARLIRDHPRLAARFICRATNVRPREDDDDDDSEEVDEEAMPPPAKRTRNK